MPELVCDHCGVQFAPNGEIASCFKCGARSFHWVPVPTVTATTTFTVSDLAWLARLESGESWATLKHS